MYEHREYEKPKIQADNFQNYEEAETYIEAIRDEYREGYGNYSGRRDDDIQKLIAEVTSDEARAIVDGTVLGMLSLGGHGVSEIDDKLIEESSIGEIKGQPGRSFDYEHYRSEFERLLVAFAIITQRLNDKWKYIPSYADMRAEDRMEVASALFYDYQAHNALRFGVDTAGIKKTDFKDIHTEDGGLERRPITSDKDKMKTDRGIVSNMLERNYASEPATHAAGKISVSEYKKLRQEFPEMNKDRFDNDVSSLRNAREDFEKRGS